MKKMLIVIGTVIIFLIFSTGFMKITTEELSTNKSAYDESLPSIAHGYTVLQQFVPQYNYVKSLEIYVRQIQCDINQGYLQSYILDSEKNVIYQDELPLIELVSSGWYTIFEDVELIAGETYYLSIDTMEALDDGPNLGFYRSLNANSKEEENQEFIYAGVLREDWTLKVSFKYLKKLYVLDCLAYYFFAIFIAVFFVTNLRKVICLTKI